VKRQCAAEAGGVRDVSLGRVKRCSPWPRTI
jgi:hypothetical protein